MAQEQSKGNGKSDEPTPFKRFADLARRLLRAGKKPEKSGKE